MEIMPFIRACKQNLLRQRLHSVENEMSKKENNIARHPCLLCCFLYTNFVFGSMFLFRNMEGHQQIIL